MSAPPFCVQTKGATFMATSKKLAEQIEMAKKEI
jgi:hypothetical protein